MVADILRVFARRLTGAKRTITTPRVWPLQAIIGPKRRVEVEVQVFREWSNPYSADPAPETVWRKQRRADRAVTVASPGRPDIPEFKIAKLDLGPNDVLVLTTSHAVSVDNAARLKTEMQRAFPGRRCVILDRGAELSVLSAADADKPTGAWAKDATDAVAAAY